MSVEFVSIARDGKGQRTSKPKFLTTNRPPPLPRPNR